MATSINLASIFGPMLVILGIWHLLYEENVKKVIDSFKKNPALLYLGGIINLIVGLTIINLSPVWSLHVTVLVTLLGWLILLKALIFFFLPSYAAKISKIRSAMHVFSGLISIVWGLALCWVGFS